MINIFSKKRFLNLLVVFIFGFFLLLLGLGSTGLVDETPPLFASAVRAMSNSGDWLTPKVNGILRFDKPPFYYWLMAIFYSIPANESCDLSLISLVAQNTVSAIINIKNNVDKAEGSLAEREPNSSHFSFNGIE